MGDSVFEDLGDVLPPEPDGELVYWMEPKPLAIGPAGISAATAGAFALGALTTVAVLGALHWMGPRRRAVVRRRGWRPRR